MTLEEVIADALPGPEHIKRRMVSEGVHNDIAKAVRDFLLSDEVVKRAGRALQEGWSFADDAGLHALPDIEFSEYEREYLARAALSSITGDE